MVGFEGSARSKLSALKEDYTEEKRQQKNSRKQSFIMHVTVHLKLRSLYSKS